MIVLVLLIMVCALIGTVLLIGVCTPLSSINIPTTPPKYGASSTVIEEPFGDNWRFNDNHSGRASSESIGKDAIRDDLREWIASSSIPTLRSRGMNDEEIKSELLQNFALTEEQVDKILAEQ